MRKLLELLEVHRLVVGYLSVLASTLIRGCVQEQFLRLRDWRFA